MSQSRRPLHRQAISVTAGTAARVAPDLVTKMRQYGVRLGTVAWVRGGDSALTESQAESMTRKGLTAKPARARSLARALTASHYAERASQVLDAGLASYPESSILFLERARLRVQLGDKRAADDFIAALNGDREHLNVEVLARLSARLTDPESLTTIQRSLSTGAWTSVRGNLDRAQSTVDALVAFRSGDPLGAIQGVPRAHADAVLALILQISSKEGRVKDLSALIEDPDVQTELDTADGQLLVQVARVLRQAGHLTTARGFATRAVQDGTSPLARPTLQAIDDDLAQLAHHWPEPHRAARSTGRPGVMGYLLHNSLPFTSGGYATRTHGLLTGMASRGWEVSAVTRPGYPLDRPEGRLLSPAEAGATSMIDGVRYSRLLHARRGYTLPDRTRGYADAVAERAREEGWSVVHAASNHPNGLAAIEAGAKLGLPSVYEVRGLWEITRMSREPEFAQTERYRLMCQLEADACLHADRVFTITEAVRDIMVDRGVPREKMTILPNGVDTERFVPLEPDTALRTELGLDGKVVVGYVGSVVDYEGLELLMDAIALLRDRKLPVAMLLVGDGAAMPSVRARVAEHGLEDVVVMTGRVPHEDVERYYSIVDIAPFPRLGLPVTEAVSPLKPFEAMAMAKPIVVSDVAALREIVTEGVNGRLFPKNDSGALADSLASLIEDEAARIALGESARTWVAEHRSWTTISERIDAVYTDLGVAGPQ